MRFREASFAVLDVETTGFSHVRDAVVEVACLVLRAGAAVAEFTSLIDPGRPIAPHATNVHGISDADVADAPRIDELVPVLRRLTRGCVVVAHNLPFDLGFLPFLEDRPAICSLRFARLTIPEAPNHKNQTLREHLGIRIVDPRAARAHRALADVLVTGAVFGECVRRYLARGNPDDVARAVSTLRAPVGSRSAPARPCRALRSAGPMA